MTEQTEGAETFRGYIDAEAAATRSFIAYKFGEVSEAEVHRLQRIAHAARERHLAALAAAEARGKCPCACCRERAALVAASRDPAGRWCSCSSYAEAEQCDCTPCAALREGLARGAQAALLKAAEVAALTYSADDTVRLSSVIAWLRARAAAAVTTSSAKSSDLATRVPQDESQRAAGGGGEA